MSYLRRCRARKIANQRLSCSNGIHARPSSSPLHACCSPKSSNTSRHYRSTQHKWCSPSIARRLQTRIVSAISLAEFALSFKLIPSQNINHPSLRLRSPPARRHLNVLLRLCRRYQGSSRHNYEQRQRPHRLPRRAIARDGHQRCPGGRQRLGSTCKSGYQRCALERQQHGHREHREQDICTQRCGQSHRLDGDELGKPD